MYGLQSTLGPQHARLQTVLAHILCMRQPILKGASWGLARLQQCSMSFSCAQGAPKAIGQAISIARGNGATVVLTTGDPGLVARHRQQFWEQLNSGSVDVLFANRCASCAPITQNVHMSILA